MTKIVGVPSTRWKVHGDVLISTPRITKQFSPCFPFIFIFYGDDANLEDTRSALTKKEKVLLFLYHMRVNPPLRVISKQFFVHRRTAARYINRVRDALLRGFVPFHYGFGDQHVVTCDDGSKRKFTKELVFGELSSWMSLKIAERFWDGVRIISIADGTYIYCENFGGFAGNKELYSGHKMRHLQKVMCFGTSRGYWVKIFAGYGGSGRYSDKKLLDYIIEDMKKELERNPEAKKFLTFFGLTADAAKENVLVVDRGFEGATEEFMTLVSPKGKAKAKESGKTRVAKQHTPKQASINRTVTRVRNSIERMFSTTIKTWAALGGRALHYSYFEHIPAYMDIACAISNAFRGCLDKKQGSNDVEDFKTMENRINHENELLRVLKKAKTGRYVLKRGKFARFDPETEQKTVPEMPEESVRPYACGPYAIKLVNPYVSFWAELGTEVKFWHLTSAERTVIKASGLKSRYSPRIGRQVFLLFKGSPRTLTDTLCTCHGGLRPIGGCAHAIAILLLLGQLTERIVAVEPTRSEITLKRALWYFQNSDSESSSESESGSESVDSDSESGESESESDIVSEVSSASSAEY